MAIVTLIGAPTDIGAGHRGASMGPEALRVANITGALRDRGLEVEDRGNLSGPTNPWQPPSNGYRHLPEVVTWNRAVYDAVYGALNEGRLPVLLGGSLPWAGFNHGGRAALSRAGQETAGAVA